jgi:hypothetical protein
MRKYATKQARNREASRRRRARESVLAATGRKLSDEHKAAILAGQRRGHAERAAAKISPADARERRRHIYPDSHPHVALYRTEKAKRVCDITPLIEAAKLELARLAELERPRRGRPRKVVNG